MLPDTSNAAQLTDPVVTAIGWFYLVTNSARVLTYMPQIVAVWRCTDGARALSLITWCSWVVSHAAAMAYGAFVVHDRFFFVISAINFTCCAAVASIAAHRRSSLLSIAATPSVLSRFNPRRKRILS